MRGCILDNSSFDRKDIDTSALADQLDEWKVFDSSRDQEIDSRIDDCEVVVTNKVRITRKNIEGTDRLGLILLAATGTDNVDLEACKERGIIVINARQYSNPSVVQHTFTLILSLMTNIIAYQHDVKQGRWSNSDIFCLLDHPIRELEGKTLGIIGYGNLGSAVARVAEAFGVVVKICQRPNSALVDGRLQLLDLLDVSDIISIHCPLTPDTHHLIGTTEFRRMKQNAILINTARGAIVEAAALAAALRSGEISGAGIDVLDQEPPAPNYPLLAMDIPNLILTPHNAWATLESRQRLVQQMADNLFGWLQNKPQNRVI